MKSKSEKERGRRRRTRSVEISDPVLSSEKRMKKKAISHDSSTVHATRANGKEEKVERELTKTPETAFDNTFSQSFFAFCRAGESCLASEL
jgi:hypothetical protein